MQKTYIMTSPTFDGEVVFNFQYNVLVGYDTTAANLSVEQITYLGKYLPKNLDEIAVFLSKSPTIEFKCMELTFDMFWNRYDEKELSSKKKAHAKWDKMSKTEQQKAYRFIGTYFSRIPYGVRKKYAETYLNSELWNN